MLFSLEDFSLCRFFKKHIPFHDSRDKDSLLIRCPVCHVPINEPIRANFCLYCGVRFNVEKKFDLLGKLKQGRTL